MEYNEELQILNTTVEEANTKKQEKPNLKGDYRNVSLLLMLYIAQGIPTGVTLAIPILLQNRGVTYMDQASFSFATWPFAVKILWAPIMDSVYINKFGRRKCWLIPSQILIGTFMIFIAQHVDNWLGDGTSKPEVIMLTITFFTLYFLAATQDVAVDGWALNLLHKRNLGYVGICGTVGVAIGRFVGYALLLVLESKEFCNKFIFSELRNEGLITISGFLKFFGVAFIAFTVLIAIFKRENADTVQELESHPDYGVKKAYPTLWRVLKMKPIILLGCLLFSTYAVFAPSDSIAILKLIDHGVPKDKIAMLSVPIFPLQIFVPLLVRRYTAGNYPMSFLLSAYKFRLVMVVIYSVLVFITPLIILNQQIPLYFYIIATVINIIFEIPRFLMYISEVSFFAKISDPLLGATYMTLMNTISNLGEKSSRTFSLWLVDQLTWRSCIVADSIPSIVFTNNTCSTTAEKENCLLMSGECKIDIDGFYIENAICVIFALVWFRWAKKSYTYLQDLPIEDWHILTNKLKGENCPKNT